MARFENPPFGRGESWSNNFAAAYTGATTDGQQLEGKEWWFEDVDPVAKVARSGRYVRCRVVRNMSGIPLLPGRLVNLALAPINSGYYGGQVDGYCTTLAARAFPLDEFLPAAGLQNYDLGWIVIEGPAKILTDLASLSPVLAIGDPVIGQTAATSQATTAGRIISDLAQLTSAATQPLANAVMNYIGRAMAAATTNNTNSSLLVDVGAF